MGVASGVSDTTPPAPTPTSTWASPTRTSTMRSRGPTASSSSTAIAPRPRGPASLKRFSTQLMAKINATIAIRLKVSCAKLPTDSESERVAPLGVIGVLHPFGCAHHVGEPDAEFVVHHHHFAARDAHAVDQHVERLAGQAVEFDDGAGRELQ
jgi:hypothetical protein